MTINTSGNVGIGTTAPGLSPTTNRRYLTIKGVGVAAGDGNGILQLTSNSTDVVGNNLGNIEWMNNAGTRMSFITSSLSNSTSESYLGFATSTTERMRIDNVGKVGINTAVPARLLDVNSSTGVAAIALAGWDVTSWSSNEIRWGGITAAQWATATFFTSGSERMRIDGNGKIIIASAPADGQFNVKGGRSYFSANNEKFGLGVRYIDTGGTVYFGAANDGAGGAALPDATICSAGGGEIARFSNAGNVGIGVSPAASAKFQVKLATDKNFVMNVGSALPSGVRLEAVNDIYNANIPLELRGTQFAFSGPTSTTYIDTAGNFGLGTPPAKRFHIYETAVDTVLRLENATTGKAAFLDFKNFTGTILHEIGIDTNGGNRYGAADALAIWGAGAKPVLIGTNGTEKMRIDSSGNVGIGISPTNAKLHINGSVSYTPTTYSGAQGNGTWITGLTAAVNASIYATNSLVASGIFSPSDARLKKDIVPITGLDAMNFINNAIPVNFNWKADNQSDYGFIAQDLLLKGYSHLITAIPDADLHAEDNYGISSPEGERFILKYDSIIPLLAAAIKELSAKNTALEARLLAAGI
jgi:hypothetical protein